MHIYELLAPVHKRFLNKIKNQQDCASLQKINRNGYTAFISTLLSRTQKN